MKCEKCQDVGFIEHNAGLLTEFCDCEKGKEILAKKRAIYDIPEEVSLEGGVSPNGESEGNDEDDSNGRIEPANSNIGSPPKPKKRRKRRVKKSA